MAVPSQFPRGVEGPIHKIDAQHVIKYSFPLNLKNVKLAIFNHLDKRFLDKLYDKWCSCRLSLPKKIEKSQIGHQPIDLPLL